MEKRSVIFFVFEAALVLLWLLSIGQMYGQSGFFGDINMIDEGQYAAWIQRLRDGEMPYRDFYFQYGPLQLVSPLVFTQLFGETMFAIRFGVSVIGTFLGILVALYVLKRFHLHPVLYGITASLIVLLPGVSIRHWIAILCFILVVEIWRHKSSFLAATTGVFIALSFLLSLEVGIFIACIITVFVAFKALRRGIHGKNISVLKYMIYGYVVTLALFAVVAYSGGWLREYVVMSWDVLTSLSGVYLPNGQGLPNVFADQNPLSSFFDLLRFLFSKAMLFYWSLFLQLVFISIIIIRFLLQNATDQDETVLLMLCFGVLVYGSIIGRSGHYFLVVPITVIAASYLLSLLLRIKNKRKSVYFLSVVFFLAFLLYGLRHIIIFRYTDFFNPQKRIASQAVIPRVSPIVVSKEQAGEILMLQSFFHNGSSPKDKIYVFNNLPAIYFLVDRANATSYDLPLLAVNREKRLQIVSQLRQTPPKFIIENKKAWAVDGISDRQRMPEIAAHIAQQYRVTHSFGDYLVYEQKKD